MGYLLNHIAQQIRTATAESLLPLGITPPQFRALETIARAQPLNQVKLGAMVDMDRSTVVHLVDHLELLGAASRQADPSDRRAHAIVLTKKGNEILVAGRIRARAVEDDFLAPLSPAERGSLIDLLRKLFDPMPFSKEKDREPSTSPPHP